MEAKSIARLELIQVAEAVSREKSIEKENQISHAVILNPNTDLK